MFDACRAGGTDAQSPGAGAGEEAGQGGGGAAGEGEAGGRGGQGGAGAAGGRPDQDPGAAGTSGARTAANGHVGDVRGRGQKKRFCRAVLSVLFVPTGCRVGGVHGQNRFARGCQEEKGGRGERMAT